MRISPPSWLPFLAAAWPLSAPVDPKADPIAQTVTQTAGVSQARAFDLAREAAALAGYARADYRIVSVEADPDGGWVVRFAPQNATGSARRCTVYVSPQGTTRVVPGR